MEFEKKELKGRMWSEQNAKVVWKGPIHINGKDEYFTILKTEVQGKPKFEILKSCGLLYLKDDQSKPNAPDIGGPITHEKIAYKFGGWEQQNPDSGDVSLSVGLLVSEIQAQAAEDSAAPAAFPADDSSEEDIPF
jgi:hypothetical protein